MFDDRSFSSTSFDARSWFGLGAIVQVVRREVIRRVSLIARWINGASKL